MDGWRIIHIVAMIWLGAGLGATYVPVLRAWASKDLEFRKFALLEAAGNETRVLVPGAMATGITGFFWAVAEDYNFFTDGWLTALTLVYVVAFFVGLPLFGFGLRRARLAVLEANKKGEETELLREVMADRVPVIFGGVLVASIPIISWLAIFKPL